MKQRIAVAGAGVFGRHHMRVLKTLDTAELTGVYDIDPARAAEAAAEHGVQAFDSLEQLAASANAAIVANAGGADVMRQGSAFTPPLLAERLSAFLDGPETLAAMGAKAHAIGINDAASRLADVVLDVAGAAKSGHATT